MDKKKSAITDFELDQLKEVINIGASHASTALSQMIGKIVNITVPEVHKEKIENIAQMIGDESKVITAILLKVYGDAPGAMVYLFPHDERTNKFIHLITKETDESKKSLSEYDISVLKEVGNILSGSSLGAFSKFLDINVVQSVSEAITDMLGSVINSLMAEVGNTSEITLFFRVNFSIKDAPDISTSFYFFIDPSATERLLGAIKAKINIG